MKKWILVLFALCILLIGGIYFFIPPAIRLSSSSTINANPEATYRLLLNEETWKKWWPGEKTAAADTSFFYGGSSYQISKKLFNAFILDIKGKNQSLSSQIMLMPLNTDSLVIEWSARITTTSNPFNKMKQYFKAKSLKNDMSDILASFESFVEKKENLYRFPVKETRVKDSVLVTIKMTSTDYPSTQEIYSLVEELRKYIAKENAVETDHPMLHVDSANGQFISMIGIHVNKLLEGAQKIVSKRMVLGNILVSEVKGGPHTIEQAAKELELYVYDHKRTSPAIPYQSLVTNRMKEPDTTRWITRLYYPVY